MVNVGLRGFLWEAKPPGHRCAREVWALGGAGGPTYHALRAFLLHANEHGFPGPGADASSGARPLAAAAPGPHPPAFALRGSAPPFRSLCAFGRFGSCSAQEAPVPCSPAQRRLPLALPLACSSFSRKKGESAVPDTKLRIT